MIPHAASRPTDRPERAPFPSPVSWATPREGVRVLLARSTLWRTLRIALVVGTLLSLINQGDLIAAGEANAMMWLKVFANYMIPWAVSSLGSLSATRTAAAQERS